MEEQKKIKYRNGNVVAEMTLEFDPEGKDIPGIGKLHGKIISRRILEDKRGKGEYNEDTEKIK